ncbi:MAG: hypothetical protein AB9869_14760 [Verrucomicrobiia bacterium]
MSSKAFLLTGRWFLLVLSLIAFSTRPQAAIMVEGVQDRQVLADRAQFRVLPEEGFVDTVRLNGSEIAAADWVEITSADFYELVVVRAPGAGGATESLRVQFIVRASERGSSEVGLPPWTPLPVIQSAPGEYAGAELELVMPVRIPAGLEIPVVAMVRTAEGRPVRVNGRVSAEGFSSFQLRRGFSSTLLPAFTPLSSVSSYAARLGGLAADKVVQVEANPAWISISGTVTGTEAWPEDARIHVVSNLTVAAEATLTVGAGAVVKLAPGVEVHANGRFIVAGTKERPVLFAPEARNTPWGGFVLRGSSAVLEMTGAILTGSGANPDWFDSNPGSGESHRQEQPLVYVANGATASLTNCYLVSNLGQAAHGEEGFLNLTGCLVQRCITTGQFNGGAVALRDSAFIEFPADDGFFADDDNDALYFTEGTHTITDCLVGWAKDDGIDAGSGGAGEVTVTGCWIESCFHEGLAWSGSGRIARVRDTVLINCGQGIEAGWDNPDVLAEGCLAAGNGIGARFGDNYDWTYEGFLRMTNSFLLFNGRDVWTMNWDDWTEKADRTDLRGTFLAATDPNYPTNALWQSSDGPLLAPFLPLLAGEPVGVGFARRANQLVVSADQPAILVGLSRFSTEPVSVEYVVENAYRVLSSGTLEFVPGQTSQRIPASALDAAKGGFAQISLRNASNAEVTSQPLPLLPETAGVPDLIARGSEWKFFDPEAAPPANWQALDFDDSAWRSGRAELGYGDGDEVTVLNGGPSTNRTAAAYFRHAFEVPDPSAFGGLVASLRRDDGGVVYLNGREVFRSNMPAGPIDHSTWADSSSTSETSYWTQAVDPSILISGTNVVAVEVHQASATSSDLSFDLGLSGSPRPRIEAHAMSAGRLWLIWANKDMQLEEATAVQGPWSTLGGVASPVLLTPNSTRFYRLRQEL